MIEKIKKYFDQIQWQSLRDPRKIGLIVFVVVVLLVSWSGIKAIQSNYNLQKQIVALRQQNSLQQLKNSNLNLQNQYYNSNQYLDIIARQEFGLGQPGETELIVPKHVALAHLAPIAKQSTSATKVNKQPAYARNFQAWIDFILHRQTTN